MEEKEKKTTKKSTTTKTGTKKASTANSATKKTVTTEKKSSTKKKPTAEKKDTETKAATPKTKKTSSKTSSTTKKTTAKSSTKKTTTKKVEPQKEEQMLEHTIIFDGLESKNITDVVNKLESENVVVDDKVIKRSKVRQVIIIILYLAIIGIIVATVAFVVKVKTDEKRRNETVNSNVYEKATQNYKEAAIEEDKTDSNSGYSNIFNIGLSTFEQKAINKEDTYFLVASSTCYWCAIFEETINDAFKDTNQNVYRLDITKMSDEEIDTFRAYYAFQSTPSIFKLEDGIITRDLVGTTTKEDLIKWINE